MSDFQDTMQFADHQPSDCLYLLLLSQMLASQNVEIAAAERWDFKTIESNNHPLVTRAQRRHYYLDALDTDR